jgi:hypothetical protein
MAHSAFPGDPAQPPASSADHNIMQIAIWCSGGGGGGRLVFVSTAAFFFRGAAM